MTQTEGGLLDLSGACVGSLAAGINPTLVSWIGDQIVNPQILASLGIGALQIRKAWKWYSREAQKFEERQRRYWHDILDEQIVMDYGIVDGGGPCPPSRFFAPPYDRVYDKNAPLPGRHALFRTLRPIVGAGLARLTARRVQELAGLVVPRKGIIRTRETVEELFTNAGIKLKFCTHLRTQDRSLLVTLGGVVSNEFVRQFLLTLPRRYHTVASVKGEPIPLDSSRTITSLRQKSREWNDSGGPLLLDHNIRYEIWKSREFTATNVRLRKPVIQPHKFEGGEIYDGVHVVVAPHPIPTGRTRAMVFAAQPLHSLGTICSDFFFRPQELLGDKEAKRFAKRARKAFRESGGRGFEAVLQVKRPRGKLTDSPRSFRGIPGCECKVTVIENPAPLLE